MPPDAIEGDQALQRTEQQLNINFEESLHFAFSRSLGMKLLVLSG